MLHLLSHTLLLYRPSHDQTSIWFYHCVAPAAARMPRVAPTPALPRWQLSPRSGFVGLRSSHWPVCADLWPVMAHQQPSKCCWAAPSVRPPPPLPIRSLSGDVSPFYVLGRPLYVLNILTCLSDKTGDYTIRTNHRDYSPRTKHGDYTIRTNHRDYSPRTKHGDYTIRTKHGDYTIRTKHHGVPGQDRGLQSHDKTGDYSPTTRQGITVPRQDRGLQSHDKTWDYATRTKQGHTVGRPKDSFSGFYWPFYSHSSQISWNDCHDLITN